MTDQFPLSIKHRLILEMMDGDIWCTFNEVFDKVRKDHTDWANRAGQFPPSASQLNGLLRSLKAQGYVAYRPPREYCPVGEWAVCTEKESEWWHDGED